MSKRILEDSCMNSKQFQGSLTLQKVKDALRHPYTFPGSYPLQMFTYGGCICHKCVRKNFRNIVLDTKEGYGDFDIRAVDILWEGVEYCVECGKQLETAYGE